MTRTSFVISFHILKRAVSWNGKKPWQCNTTDWMLCQEYRIVYVSRNYPESTGSSSIVKNISRNQGQKMDGAWGCLCVCVSSDLWLVACWISYVYWWLSLVFRNVFVYWLTLISRMKYMFNSHICVSQCSHYKHTQTIHNNFRLS